LALRPSFLGDEKAAGLALPHTSAMLKQTI
jgi:hypothetical protein